MKPTVSDTQAAVPAASSPTDEADAEDKRYLRAMRPKQARALARFHASANPQVEAANAQERKRGV